MSIEKMSHVRISGDVHFLEEVFFICEMDNNFHPIYSQKTKDGEELGKLSEQNPYTKIMQQIIDIGNTAGIDVREDFISDNIAQNKQMVSITGVGYSVEQHIDKFKQVMNAIIPNSMDEYTPADILSLNKIKTLLGYVPKDKIDNFRNIENDKFLFIEAIEEKNVYWCIYFTAKEHVEYCHEYMQERGFHDVWLPTFAPTDHEDYDHEYEDSYIQSFNETIKHMLDDEAKIKQSIYQYNLAIEHMDNIHDMAENIQNVISDNDAKIQLTMPIGSEVEQHINKFWQIINKIIPDSANHHIPAEILSLNHIKTLLGYVLKEDMDNFKNIHDEKFLFVEGLEEKDRYWCVCFTTNEYAGNCRQQMGDKGFNEVWLPTFATTDQSHENHCDNVEDDFYDKIKHMLDQETEIKQDTDQYHLAIDHGKDNSFEIEHALSGKDIKIRFGRLPVESLSKLSIYSEELFTFKIFTIDNQYYWGMYMTNIENQQEVDKIFEDILFERVLMAEDNQGDTSDMKASFQKIVKAKQEELCEMKAKISIFVNENHEHLVESYYKTKFLNDSFEIRKYVGMDGDTFYFEGFIPTIDEDRLLHEFHTITELTIEISPAEEKTGHKAPTKFKNNRFSKPFESLVSMYGVPSYGDFDPTNVLAVTYTLLYGVMFGDVGQGLLLVLFGYLFFKKTGNCLGQIMMRVGVSSSIFGFAYGSVFGFENVLDPIFIDLLGMDGKPIHVMDPVTTTKILIAAVIIGCILNLMSMTINVAIGFSKKDYTRAVFSCNGLVGIFMYSGILVGAALTMLADINVFSPIYIIGIVVVPLILILFSVPLGNIMAGKKENIYGEEGFKGIATEGIFELFEVVLSFISNTMSFLRVGGFILSHAGMMLVVMTLYEMVGGVGGIVVIIVGNLFVIGLEGFIVGIQALRLEFYEMFSRYYDGDGVEFTPITIKR